MTETDPGEYISFAEEDFDYLIDQHTYSDRIEKELSDIVDNLKEARYDIGSSSFVNLPDDNDILIQYMHQLEEEVETKGILNKEVVDRGEIRGRGISINISGSEVPQKKSKIESIASDFGFDFSEEIKDNITIHKETEGDYSDGEYPFRHDAILILLIFGEIFEQNVEPSELIQSVVSIYEEVERSVKVDHSVDEPKKGGELTSDSEESREEEKTKLSSEKNGGRREKGQSIPSITESARGDLDTDILEEIESDYGFGFLEPDEQIQYIGESTWGIRITSDAVDDRLGYANHSFVTDRGIRLVIKSGDDLVDDIVIGYDCIKKIEYNSGITKDSITVHTNEDRTLDVSELNISFQREVSDKQTKEPTIESPAIKFRLRASVQSGTSVDDIMSYIRRRVEDSERAKILSDELVSQVLELDHKEISVPSPQSFDSPKKCEEKYDDLEKMIEKWSVAESTFNEVKESRSKIIDQLPAHNRETWVRIVPNIDTPKEFDTADEAILEYTSLQEDFEELGSAINGISIIFEHNSVISEYAPERSEFDPSSVLEKITTTVERELNSQRDVSEVGKDLERTGDILTVSSRLADEGGDLPIEPFLQEVIEHLQNEGIPESEELQEWHELIQKVETVSTFMDDVDLSHPSIDAEHWEESLEMALEEQYVNVLSPIADQVEKMESGMWELDDLYQISWQEFETLIGTLYESFGYETEVTSDTADMGIDVWATNADERVAVQAKRYQEGNRVGRETLQKLASTLAKGDADRVIVVTTSEFARTAKEYSDSFGSEIELIDGEELRDQLNNSDIPPIN